MVRANSSTVSANTLFHFTPKLEYLLGILTSNFYPRYCLEDHSAFFTSMDAEDSIRAIPMVCFCDIPLSNIRNHIEWYGRYAIGLSKDWGKKKGISPITYFLDNSISVEVMKASFSTFYENIQRCYSHSQTVDIPIPLRRGPDRLIDNLSFDFGGVHNALLRFMQFTKEYKGKVRRGDGLDQDKCFYDEREWRYIPKDLFFDSDLSFINKIDFEANVKKDELNQRLVDEGYVLEFEPSDIKYIIVSDESEIPSMIQQIRDIKGGKYNNEQINLLQTRLISMEQILQDF